MKPNIKFLVKTFIGIFSLLFYCEYIIYYQVQKHCDYPALDPNNEDKTVEYGDEGPLKVMVLADTHLLGSRNGHIFDKLRREWQMYRAFQTAIDLHKPDLVFVLGDLTDEGLWCSREEFNYYVHRFYSLFSVPEQTKLYVTVGNHDIGFHYGISLYLNQRFVSAFNAPAVQIISLKGNHFVLINSMALEGDGCFLCRPAEIQLTQIEKMLKCAKGVNYGKCDNVPKLDKYTKPILLQHFPLYRQSDMDCSEPDSAPYPIKKERFRERWECLSQEATEQLMNQLRPRLVMSGHTHHGCMRPLPTGEGIEITVPSFSWRNKENPSYSLLTITPNNYAVFRCPMPRETSVINTYIFGACILVVWIIYNIFSRSHRRKWLNIFEEKKVDTD